MPRRRRGIKPVHVLILGIFAAALIGGNSASATVRHIEGTVVHSAVHAALGGGGCSGLGAVTASEINSAAATIGISCHIVYAQINEESGGQLGLTSPAGAEGPAQFMPGTWQSEGCAGSIWDASSAMACYAQFMKQLLNQEGNIRDALAAYNAGAGNLSAGMGYADTILSAAGQ